MLPLLTQDLVEERVGELRRAASTHVADTRPTRRPGRRLRRPVGLWMARVGARLAGEPAAVGSVAAGCT